MRREEEAETCDKRRGSLNCEECDKWIVIKTIPKSERYPPGFLVEGCMLDAKEGSTE